MIKIIKKNLNHLVLISHKIVKRKLENKIQNGHFDWTKFIIKLYVIVNTIILPLYSPYLLVFLGCSLTLWAYKDCIYKFCSIHKSVILVLIEVLFYIILVITILYGLFFVAKILLIGLAYNMESKDPFKGNASTWNSEQQELLKKAMSAGSFKSRMEKISRMLWAEQVKKDFKYSKAYCKKTKYEFDPQNEEAKREWLAAEKARVRMERESCNYQTNRLNNLFNIEEFFKGEPEYGPEPAPKQEKKRESEKVYYPFLRFESFKYMNNFVNKLNSLFPNLKYKYKGQQPYLSYEILQGGKTLYEDQWQRTCKEFYAKVRNLRYSNYSDMYKIQAECEIYTSWRKTVPKHLYEDRFLAFRHFQNLYKQDMTQDIIQVVNLNIKQYKELGFFSNTDENLIKLLNGAFVQHYKQTLREVLEKQIDPNKYYSLVYSTVIRRILLDRRYNYPVDFEFMWVTACDVGDQLLSINISNLDYVDIPPFSH